jgi:mono/diheme cytochrome c family protein
MFQDNGCNACHPLADANAAGSVGPSFDGNANLDKDHAVQVITDGQGPMPSFGWLGEEDINLIAAYIVQVKK